MSKIKDMSTLVEFCKFSWKITRGDFLVEKFVINQDDEITSEFRVKITALSPGTYGKYI